MEGLKLFLAQLVGKRTSKDVLATANRYLDDAAEAFTDAAAIALVEKDKALANVSALMDQVARENVKAVEAESVAIEAEKAALAAAAI
jgi:hypothetical protein